MGTDMCISALLSLPPKMRLLPKAAGVSKPALQNKAQLCCSMLDRPPGPTWGEQVELHGEQGLRRVKTKALLFVGTKETK